MRRSGRLRKGLWSSTLLVLLVVVNVIINNPISNARLWSGTIGIALIFSSSWIRRRNALRIVVVLALIFGLVLFPYAAYFRYSSGFHETGGVTHSLETSGDYDAFQMIAVSQQVVSMLGHTGGKQFGAAVLFFVPRSVWPSKATDSGTYLAGVFHLPFNNLSAPLWAEMYLDFGFGGVAILFAAYGWFLKRVDDEYVRRSTDFARIAGPIVAGYSFIVLRGSLLQATGRLVAIALLLWFMSAKAKRSDMPTEQFDNAIGVL